MKNNIRKDFLMILATAPKKAILQYIETLKTEEEKDEAQRLAKALKIL